MNHSKAWGFFAAAASVAVVGCGSNSSNYANLPKPASLLNVTAAISNNKVLVSPDHVGAGQIKLIVANETGSSQQLTLSNGISNRTDAQTGPINPGGTASIQYKLRKGQYQVAAGDPSIAAATIVVGARRPSAQNQLLNP